jgi:UDP-N-acetylmuramoyl-tripeptide--D-alanyl-D-alanine ligase
MKLSDVAKALKLPLPCDDVTCQGVSIDSRTAAENSLFFAIKGDNNDGHQYVSQLAGRCAAAVVDHAVETSLPCFQVLDTQVALTELAGYWRGQLSAPVVAITGSCGKTTARALLASLLAQSFNTHASEKSYNNDIGVPLTVLQATPEHERLVFEVGTSYPGEIARHSQLLRPDIAIILMAAAVHLEGLGDLKGVVQEKGDLLLGLADDGIAILNRDDPNYGVWEKRVLPTQSLISFGQHPEATVRADDIVVEADGRVNFKLITAGISMSLTLPMMGKHNVYNALAAIAAALQLGVQPEQLQAGLSAAELEPRRLQLKSTSTGATIIDDSYNANPHSMQAAIELLAETPAATKVVVMGDMAELGEGASDYHRQVGEQAKALGISALHGYGSESQAAVSAFGEHGYHWQDHQAIANFLADQLDANTVVLVKGSNSMHMNKVAQALTEEK